MRIGGLALSYNRLRCYALLPWRHVAFRTLTTSEPYQLIKPVQTYKHEEIYEKRILCMRIMKVLIDVD